MKKHKIMLGLAMATLLALAFTANAHAQLMGVDGSFQGIFTGTLGGPSILNTNGTSPPNTNLVPGTGGKFLVTTVGFDTVLGAGDSWITFTGGTFTGLNIPVDPLSTSTPVGIPTGTPGINVDFNIFNGNENGNTSATFDLYLNLTAPILTQIKVATITFGLPIPGDTHYTQTVVAVPSFFVGTTLVKFDLDVNTSYTILNNNDKNFTDTAQFSVVAVPEPSTYGLLGAVALLGLIGAKRIRDKFTAVGPDAT